MNTTKTINIKNRPIGKPELTDFDFTISEKPVLKGKKSWNQKAVI